MTKIWIKNPEHKAAAQCPHKAVKCGVLDCQEEAIGWIDISPIKETFHLKQPETFYLCDEHASELAPTDEILPFLNPLTGEITRIELAVYSCDEDCKTCNQ